MNKPVSWLDPFGLAPLDEFGSCDDAGKDGAKYIADNPLKVDGEHFEQGAPIFKTPDGKYYYTPPAHGKSPLPGKTVFDYGFKKSDKDKVAGDVHDHIKGEDFSKEDKERNKGRGIPGYLATPNGDIKKFDPTTGKTDTIGECKAK